MIDEQKMRMRLGDVFCTEADRVLAGIHNGTLKGADRPRLL